ncbi:type II secretion system protein GspC [Parahaliea mediterranea]|uniref:Type II secretion system protein GspC n=1 Tax=Parahaliea mediterranea TaxID=651086 RepID=A0A939DC42_9GAMM|nr:type II secretion system protein GspC [Parahaliea mediterranea]
MQQSAQGLAQPARLRLLRRGLLVLLALWAVLALVQLFWALWPQPAPTPLPADIVNPVSRSQGAPETAGVNIDRLVGRKLFGEPGAEPGAAIVEAAPVSGASAREGIEDGARETRLDLILRGVVASTDDGLGHAIIEYRKRQDVYAVDDELPVSGNVRLAKVMPGQVVLDNNGTYELLTLFEESEFDRQLRDTATAPAAAAPRETTHVDKREDAQATELAAGYRAQLYQNPQSLASLVRISAVREGGELRGYRVAPGREAVQFQQLGFKAGDLVTSVNGISLDDPANTMQLYQTMRTASEAVFELERDGQPMSVSVDLGAGAQQQ